MGHPGAGSLLTELEVCMIIGVPGERKTLEKRIAITPDGVRELVKRGHKVLVETGAGAGSFFEDAAFEEAGASIAPSLEAVWTKSDMIVKVKEPHESEYRYFRKDLILFDYLHLASMPDVTSEMLKGKITGIAYELVQLNTGRLPLLEPMSEVAGKLSILVGSYFLLSQNGGRGELLAGTVGTSPAKVVVVGAGVAGRAAAETAYGAGAEVVVLDINYKSLERIKELFHGRVKTLYSTESSLMRELSNTSLLVGAVLVPGAAAPKVISREMINVMPKASVLVDISIDQGGCAATSKPTCLDNPVYTVDGVTHYCVTNMPAQTPRTSTLALTAATLPYVIRLADQGLDALSTCTELRCALNAHNGALTNKAVSDAVGGTFTSIDEALGG